MTFNYEDMLNVHLKYIDYLYSKTLKYKTVISSLLLLLACEYSFADCHTIDDQAQQIMQKNKINGMAIAIINQGNSEFCNYGYIAANQKEKINQHTLFEIASISKTFTATLAGIAVVQGKFDLQKPIANYVGVLKTNLVYQDINSQELLAHVSGLNFTQEKNFTPSNQVAFMNGLKSVQVQHAPETYYQYGQVGISLVALALEENEKSTYHDILQKQLLNKLGMYETFIDVPSHYKNKAIGYGQDNQAVAAFNTGSLTPAAGLKSSTQDMAKYLNMQLNGHHDSVFEKALSLIHKNYYCLYADGTYQQLAWVYHPHADLTSVFTQNTNNAASVSPQKLAQHCAYDPNGFIEKSGNSYGMSSYVIYMPSVGAGVVVLTNKALVSDTVNLGRAILKQIAQ